MALLALTRSLARFRQTCNACSAWTGVRASLCQSTNSKFGLPSTAVYCQTPIITDLTNYVQLTLSLTSVFADGSSSASAANPQPLFLGSTPSSFSS